jgi:hypothetical protein
MLRITLIALIILLTAVFCVSIFKNLAYPLLWNDEAETTMFGQRILSYGYPKVSDGKNVLNDLELPDKSLSVDARTGAWRLMPWGQYYVASLGVLLAHGVADIYAKTYFVRLPFAILGFLGVLLMGLSAYRAFGRIRDPATLGFLSLFLLFELASVPLTLHLREVRWYSLNIFLSACIFYTYFNYVLFNKLRPSTYIVLMSVLLIAVFNCFAQGYFIFIASIGVFELIRLIRHFHPKLTAITLMPFFLTLPIIAILIWLYGFLTISHEFERFFSIGFQVYRGHLQTIVAFFWNCELLLLAIIMKILALGAYGLAIQKPPAAVQKFKLSVFFSIFFIAQALIIAKTPLLMIFERYFIILQPVLMLMLLLDSFLFFQLVWHNRKQFLWRSMLVVVLPVSMFILYSGSSIKLSLIKAHVYELMHQYKGPIDFVIPYLKNKYDHPERFVIATNYEELSYMYYLGSKVTIGFVGNNLEKDMGYVPDIIIRRNKFTYTNYVFDKLFKMAPYKKISFPVTDYFVNNIAETRWHLFATPVSTDQSDWVNIYIRDDLVKKDYD